MDAQIANRKTKSGAFLGHPNLTLGGLFFFGAHLSKCDLLFALVHLSFGENPGFTTGWIMVNSSGVNKFGSGRVAHRNTMTKLGFNIGFLVLPAEINLQSHGFWSPVSMGMQKLHFWTCHPNRWFDPSIAGLLLGQPKPKGPQMRLLGVRPPQFGNCSTSQVCPDFDQSSKTQVYGNPPGE